MLLDASIWFIAPGVGQSMVGAAGVAIPSTQTVDLLGNGVGVAPTNIIGNVSTYGTNIGTHSGMGQPVLLIATANAFTTGNGATLTVALQLAPDTGAGGNYQPGTWQTIDQSPALTAAQLTANTKIWTPYWLPNFPKTLRPRYARLLFQVPAGTNFTGGSIAYAATALGNDDGAFVQAANNIVA